MNRYQEMAALYSDGATLTEIGLRFGVSKQCVHIHLKKIGANGRLRGGKSVQMQRRDAASKEKRDAKYMAEFGCTYAQLKQLGSVARRAYWQQNNNAKMRGVEWKFNLWQWWIVWRDSGKWNFRGIGQGYVMCRYGDAGPYSPDNVFIAPARINTSETSHKKSGLPTGVYHKGNYYSALRFINGKRHYQGYLESPEEAHSIYLKWGGELSLSQSMGAVDAIK